MDKKDEIILQQLDVIRSMTERNLRSVNSDYDAKRSGNIFLDRLSITVAAPGLFERWLASTGKLGGQRKVPRLSNDRHIMDAITALGDAPESR